MTSAGRSGIDLPDIWILIMETLERAGLRRSLFELSLACHATLDLGEPLLHRRAAFDCRLPAGPAKFLLDPDKCRHVRHLCIVSDGGSPAAAVLANCLPHAESVELRLYNLPQTASPEALWSPFANAPRLRTLRLSNVSHRDEQTAGWYPGASFFRGLFSLLDNPGNHGPRIRNLHLADDTEPGCGTWAAREPGTWPDALSGFPRAAAALRTVTMSNASLASWGAIEAPGAVGVKIYEPQALDLRAWCELRPFPRLGEVLFEHISTRRLLEFPRLGAGRVCVAVPRFNLPRDQFPRIAEWLADTGVRVVLATLDDSRTGVVRYRGRAEALEELEEWRRLEAEMPGRVSIGRGGFGFEVVDSR